jgi:hypothetical protein
MELSVIGVALRELRVSSLRNSALLNVKQIALQVLRNPKISDTDYLGAIKPGMEDGVESLNVTSWRTIWRLIFG